MSVGIDQIAFYTPHYFLDLKTLAEARGVDYNKYAIGLGQYKMAVPPPDETIVTMAANAAEQVLHDVDTSTITTLLFATESGIDQSKAAGIFVHSLLQLPQQCRVVELKQACYSATAGLKLAMALLQQNPKQRILLIASDIARYGLGTPGEPSQGGGSVAMLLSANPRLLAIEPESGLYTEDAMDFWRPNYREEALVEGKYSCDLYMKALKNTWEQYQQLSGHQYTDHNHFLYHIPIPRLAEKAHQCLSQLNGREKLDKDTLQKEMGDTLQYSRIIGNCYTGSLYLGLTSLLEHKTEDLSNQRIGFYSYGSGCVAEFFSGVIQPGYQEVLHTDYHKAILDKRVELSIEQYETFYQYQTPKDGSKHDIPTHKTGRYRLAGVNEHKPIYQTHEQGAISAKAPGKIIISGEHAVVYGAPAIAMAIDCYATTTISQEPAPSVLFDLMNIEHKGRYTFNKLRNIKHRLQDAHGKFLRGERGIRDVVKKPFELLQYTTSNVIDTLNPSLQSGLKVRSHSDLPIGCGMGSSAATIVSTNFALAHYLQHDLESKKHLELSLAAENMQHGRSSGLDLHIATHGGCIHFEKGESTPLPIPEFPMYLVNTGEAISSTGECVSHAASYFEDKALLHDFKKVTTQVEQAIQNQDVDAFMQGIRDNHALLVKIGVVPEHIQAFVRRIEDAGGAAKVCGAGTLTGDQAGALLVVSPMNLETIASEFGYELEPISCDENGVQLV